jgi:hypothetical protein
VLSKFVQRLALWSIRNHDQQKRIRDFLAILDSCQTQNQITNGTNEMRFAPELLAIRSEILDQLSIQGMAWLVDFSSVDALHDVYGIEVRGVANATTAETIFALLSKRLPHWDNRRICNCINGREPGFRIRVHRDREQPPENW